MIRGVRIDDTITMEDLKRMISMQTILNFEPGSQYMYSNSNFTPHCPCGGKGSPV